MRLSLPISLGSLGVIAATLALHSCDGLRFQCFDGEDNDGDGLVDDQDPGCAVNPETAARRAAHCQGSGSGLPVDDPACDSTTSDRGARESDDPPCFDRRDNDDDGYVDFPEDPGCTNAFDTSEQNPECSDGIDNDGDGLTDFHQDPGCIPAGGSVGDPRGAGEAGDPACTDGIDNDGDGAVDYPQDLGCTTRLDRAERNPECSDGVDNDGDGRVDGNDLDCTTALQDREAAFACNDGIDNDGDGLADFGNDPGCLSRAGDDEINPACMDGADNDGDGSVDFPADPGCTGSRDDDETEPACGDGRDNDGDGHVDFPADVGCNSREDASELSAQCIDGIDNDGDGRFDAPDDPGCSSIGDDNEGDELACADGVDNDGDGYTDFPADPDCTGVVDGSEAEAPGDCSDGIDNDGDGAIDGAVAGFNVGDPACRNGFIFERLDPECDDGIDNDGDGRADFAGVDRDFNGSFAGAGEFRSDPGCSSAGFYTESIKPQCADGVDNDADGTADANGVDLNGDGVFNASGELRPDTNCGGDERGRTELAAGFVEQCRDGIDNDGDSLVDYHEPFIPGTNTADPNYSTRDVGCTGPFDNTE